MNAALVNATLLTLTRWPSIVSPPWPPASTNNATSSPLPSLKCHRCCQLLVIGTMPSPQDKATTITSRWGTWSPLPKCHEVSQPAIQLRCKQIHRFNKMLEHFFTCPGMQESVSLLTKKSRYYLMNGLVQYHVCTWYTLRHHLKNETYINSVPCHMVNPYTPRFPGKANWGMGKSMPKCILFAKIREICMYISIIIKYKIIIWYTKKTPNGS